MSDQDNRTISLPIEWRFPEDITSRYATNMVVQHTEHEFIISFFEARPPFVVGSGERLMSQLKEVKSVQAECVARIIVAAERMPGFINALTTNYQDYLKNVGKLEEE